MGVLFESMLGVPAFLTYFAATLAMVVLFIAIYIRVTPYPELVLIRATRGAHTALLDLEEQEEEALDAFRRRYQALASAARVELASGADDTGTPEP